MNCEIDISNHQQAIQFDPQQLVAAVEQALRIEQVAAAVISISIVDNAAIHAVNRDHLQHDYPTDVISFQLDFRDLAASDESEPDDDEFASVSEEDSDPENEYLPDSDCDAEGYGAPAATEEQRVLPATSDDALRARGAMIEGEIIASAEMAAQMATQPTGEAEFDPFAELTLYVIHGLLHICGYDDLTLDEQAIMRSREAVIMQSLGLKTRAH